MRPAQGCLHVPFVRAVASTIRTASAHAQRVAVGHINPMSLAQLCVWRAPSAPFALPRERSTSPIARKGRTIRSPMPPRVFCARLGVTIHWRPSHRLTHAVIAPSAPIVHLAVLPFVLQVRRDVSFRYYCNLFFHGLPCAASMAGQICAENHDCERHGAAFVCCQPNSQASTTV